MKHRQATVCTLMPDSWERNIQEALGIERDRDLDAPIRRFFDAMPGEATLLATLVYLSIVGASRGSAFDKCWLLSEQCADFCDWIGFSDSTTAFIQTIRYTKALRQQNLQERHIGKGPPHVALP